MVTLQVTDYMNRKRVISMGFYNDETLMKLLKFKFGFGKGKVG